MIADILIGLAVAAVIVVLLSIWERFR